MGASTATSPRALEATSEACTRRVRPNRSESGPATSRPTASEAVVAETARVAAAGVWEKSDASRGSSGCGA